MCVGCCNWPIGYRAFVQGLEIEASFVDSAEWSVTGLFKWFHLQCRCMNIYANE